MTKTSDHTLHINGIEVDALDVNIEAAYFQKDKRHIYQDHLGFRSVTYEEKTILEKMNINVSEIDNEVYECLYFEPAFIDRFCS